jgi:hypothetical protein
MLYNFEAATWHHYICEAILSSSPDNASCGEIFGYGEDSFTLELYEFSENVHVEFERLIANQYRYDQGVPLYELPYSLAKLFWSKVDKTVPLSKIPRVDVSEIAQHLKSLMVKISYDEISTSTLMNISQNQYRLISISKEHLMASCIKKLELSTQTTSILKTKEGYLVPLKDIVNTNGLPLSDITKSLIQNAKTANFKMVEFSKDGHVFDHLLRFEH